MDQSQPSFGGQNSVNLGGTQGDFSGFAMNGGGMNMGGAGMNGGVDMGGDIVLSSDNSHGKSGKKKFVIIGALLCLAAIGCAVAAVFLGGDGGGGLFGGSDYPGFKELSEFIEKGDEETRKLFGDDEEEEAAELKLTDDGSEEGNSEEVKTESETEQIMAIRIAEKGETEVKKYYKKLASLEQNFYNKSTGKVDSSLMAEYGNALKVLRNAVDYYDAKEGLVSAYENGGDDGAEMYFDENIKCDKDTGEALATMCSFEEDYYSILLKRHRLFSDVGCCTKTGCDYVCAGKSYSDIGEDFEYLLTECGEFDYFARELKKSYSLSIINNKIAILHKSIMEGN